MKDKIIEFFEGNNEMYGDLRGWEIAQFVRDICKINGSYESHGALLWNEVYRWRNKYEEIRKEIDKLIDEQDKKGQAYMLYGTSGGIEKVMYDITNRTGDIHYSGILKMLECLKEKNRGAFDLRDLSIRLYGYDDRLKKMVFIITTKRYGNDNYEEQGISPQFVSFMVELGEDD